MKRYIALIFSLIMLLSIMNVAFAYDNETVFGNKFDGDILFNNLQWGISKDDVVRFLEEKFNSEENNVKIEEKYNEYDYGTLKDIICTYTNSNGGIIGTVGDMDIDEIVIRYIYEEGKYNYSMYSALYSSEDYGKYSSMLEMLEYKYGSPYSHYEEDSESYGSTFNIDMFRWLSADEKQRLSITRNNNVYDFGIFFGKSSKTYEKNIDIAYSRIDISDYVNNQRIIYEAQQKEEEMANKDYDGL